ncbi:MAG TPA: GAF domain-containing protein, partial [Anaerolineae bacterium]|nr:GAF domain-containing protein [Anaerolineae bacterium]
MLAALDALSLQVAILDDAGTILAVNASWRDFADANHLGWADYGVGRNYLQVCDSASGYSAEGARAAAGGIRQVIACLRQEFSLEYPCHSPAQERWFLMRATRAHGDNAVRVVVSHEDITDRKRPEKARREPAHDLGERLVELNCLYKMSELANKPGISLEEIVQQTLTFLPSAWQYPEITVARAILGDREWKTEKFARTPWAQAHDIVVQGKPVGSLEVRYLEERPLCDEGPFLKKERHLLRAIAEQLGRSIEHVRTEDALAWEAGVHAAMAELSKALIRSLSLEDIALLILENAKGLTGSRFGYVGYIDPETGYILAPTLTRDIWDICQIPEKDIVFKEFRGLWGWVLEHKLPLLSNEPANDPRASGTPQGHIPIQHFISVPALVGDELVGQISLANPDRHYTEQDLGLVEHLASLYALAVRHKRSDMALLETTRLLETILDHTHVLVGYMDSRFNFLRVNRAYAEADQREPSFFPGKNHFDLYPSKQNEAIFRCVVETGQPYAVYAKPFEYPDHPERGVSYWDWGLVPLKSSDGTVTGLVLTLANVTDRVQAEQARRGSEKLLAAIAANYPAYLSIIEQDGEDLTVGFTSGKEFSRLGLDPEDFAGMPLAEVFGDQAPIVREYYLKAFGGEEISFDLYIN